MKTSAQLTPAVQNIQQKPDLPAAQTFHPVAVCAESSSNLPACGPDRRAGDSSFTKTSPCRSLLLIRGCQSQNPIRRAPGALIRGRGAVRAQVDYCLVGNARDHS